MPIIFCRLLDIGVSQIVKTVMFDPCTGQNLLENFPNCRLGQVAAVSMGKDQIGESAIVPDIPRVRSLPLLELFAFLENLHDERCRSNGAGLIIFQRPKLESTAFFARLEKLLFYMDHTHFKIHAVPGQPQQFAGTHPGKTRVVTQPGFRRRFFQSGQLWQSVFPRLLSLPSASSPAAY